MAQVLTTRGDHETARGLLDQAAALFRHGFYPDIRPIAAMKARVQIAAGDLSAATAWAEERGISIDDDAEFLREYEHLTLARLLLAEHRAEHGREPSGSDSLVALLGLLQRLHAAAAATGRGGSLLEIRVLQALTHQAQGDLPQALDALTLALSEAPEPGSRVRLFLDEGAPMQALLDLVQRTEPAEPGGVPPSSGDTLSRRELDVLRLLDTELTGPEIARQLYCSEATVKAHLTHIFTKAGCDNRVQLALLARDAGPDPS